MSAVDEIAAGDRFGFGANWTRFLTQLDDQRIADAEASLREMLRVDDLRGKTFLDIGSGSGLFSLAARRLGATVHSLDFDPQSVACTQELRRRYFPDDRNWRVEQGSALDPDYLRSLGTFDIVYSWGVLHHTGSMWLGFEYAIERVAADGKLFVAIYNDQGARSHLWWLIKAFYNKLPRPLRWLFMKTTFGAIHAAQIVRCTLRGRPMDAIRPLLDDARERGMSAKYDAVDWIGGYPFEVATFELLERYFGARGFRLINSKRTTSWGCNELALQRTGP
ncbi:MAG TPA: class I SAM-dependent methyltransferase [Steroidobacteraceae bacterium]|nr:class I SAM-dependent methyltransferase [Steroidobacteraceae bacterium]